MAHPKVVLALPYPFPGDTALVGAPQHDVGDNADQGSVYVFVRTGATWSFQQKLTAPDGAAGDYFGFAVSLFGDTALVGAPLHDVGDNVDQGSAYVFVRTGTTWSFQQKLTAPDGAAFDSLARPCPSSRTVPSPPCQKMTSGKILVRARRMSSLARARRGASSRS